MSFQLTSCFSSHKEFFDKMAGITSLAKSLNEILKQLTTNQ